MSTVDRRLDALASITNNRQATRIMDVTGYTSLVLERSYGTIWITNTERGLYAYGKTGGGTYLSRFVERGTVSAHGINSEESVTRDPPQAVRDAVDAAREEGST